ncbi:MAG TPA: type I-C CRISPR-associated protein Cas7/Csd2 [Actinobacteria bacterium]|jgi:CRISPR-associated protein Csd2|nr:type I-C CRISPR-associated protein Cas7/Csd2 [Actinomycetota bacterium]
MNNLIKNRYEFVYLFDVENGNPNGDPDSGNMPRIDPETSFGIVTDVCLKRKIRNYIDIVKKNESPYKIYVREKAVLTTERKDAYEALSVKDKEDKLKSADLGRIFMCKNYFDIRAFGAVMSVKENNCGQVRGPVQLNFARSIESIVPLEVTITRMAVETEGEREKERMMGRKHIVPYGLYRAEGYISAFLAEQTEFNNDDLELLWEALINMFDHDHSAARGKMNARKLFVFKHSSQLGDAPAQKLFDLISINRSDDSIKPARTFNDYVVSVNKSAIPDRVLLEEKL